MITIESINNRLEGQGIIALDLRENSPACEKYVFTRFLQKNGSHIDTMVPYEYRRSGLHLETSEEIATHLITLKKHFTSEYINEWCLNILSSLSDDNTTRATFLRILLGSHCKEITQNKFPQNNNPQKIIQSIKDDGYVISVLRGKKRENGGQTRYWLLPIPLAIGTLNETMSVEFRKYVMRVLGNIDVYENKESVGVLPDHKFSEIRWDENVPEKNYVGMPDNRIREKFQMLTTQRNQQKREVCRHCYKTGERGTIYGIKFYYKGTDKWDDNIPKVGKDAEKGCVGCPWYDIKKWREEIQNKLKTI